LAGPLVSRTRCTPRSCHARASLPISLASRISAAAQLFRRPSAGALVSRTRCTPRCPRRRSCRSRIPQSRLVWAPRCPLCCSCRSRTPRRAALTPHWRRTARAAALQRRRSCRSRIPRCLRYLLVRAPCCRSHRRCRSSRSLVLFVIQPTCGGFRLAWASFLPTCGAWKIQPPASSARVWGV